LFRLSAAPALPVFPWRQAFLLILVYVALGYIGIRYAAFPGTFFAQVWLTSGIGLIMFSLFRYCALPLVWFASLLINGTYALQAMHNNGVWATVALIVFSPLFDTLQSFLAWRLWRLDNEPRFSRIGLQRFLVAIIVAVSISIAGMVILYLAVGLISIDELFPRFTMMALSDMQGLFLVVPLWLALRNNTSAIMNLPLVFSALAIPVPLLLARFEPSLAALLFPLVAFIIIRLRFIGAALAVSVAGGSAALLVILGLDPLHLDAGIEAFSRWSLIVLALGTPMLLMGVVLDDNLDYQSHLEARVAERTQALQDALAAANILVITDSLTQVFNRRHMESLVHDEVERAQRYHQSTALIILDIDHFKAVNDNYGHPMGDRVLRQVSDILSENLRQSDALGRWGGEEFLILLPQINVAAATSVAEKLRQAIFTAEFGLNEPLSVSLGVADLQRGESAGDWIKRADQALYHAKRLGRNQVALAKT
jgi:diguanylate cyclase (GGDEF)-like protein